MTDWKIFLGTEEPHDGILALPPPPPWRSRPQQDRPFEISIPTQSEQVLRELSHRASTFVLNSDSLLSINAALILRRPLLVIGPPGTGKSTLIYKVAHELKLGSVLRWSINSRTTVKSGIYDYDAVGRLQSGPDSPLSDFFVLGPLGTALISEHCPRALLIDEIDKSDLDFSNDLLDVIEEGTFEIPELRRLKDDSVTVRTADGQEQAIKRGRLACKHFPFTILTCNTDREFPPALLRRCIRLHIAPPSQEEMLRIIERHFGPEIAKLANAEQYCQFESRLQSITTDQVLNSIFVTLLHVTNSGRAMTPDDKAALLKTILRHTMPSDSYS